MGELRKSHVGDDFFFMWPASKKTIKKHNINVDIQGRFHMGQRWAKRTGADCIKRIHRYCIKYLGKGLILRPEKGLFNLLYTRTVR